jgi:hypothetical protein
MSVTNKTIRDLENAAMEAVQAMNELVELLEGGGSTFLRDRRIANRVERLRLAAIELDRAETACSRERTLTMSEEEMREEFEALGLDWDETTERGHALMQRLLAEHDTRREAEIAAKASELAAGMGVGLEDAADKIRTGFKLPDAPAEPQPRRIGHDVPPDPSGPKRVVRLDAIGTHEDDEGEFPDTFVCDVCNLEVPVGDGGDDDMPGACAACWCAAHPEAQEAVEAMRETAGSVGDKLAELAVRPGHATREPGESEAEYISRLRTAYVDADKSTANIWSTKRGEPQLRSEPIGHHSSGLGDGGKSETERWYESVREISESTLHPGMGELARECIRRSEGAPKLPPSALAYRIPLGTKPYLLAVIIGFVETEEGPFWVSDHGLQWARGLKDGDCYRPKVHQNVQDMADRGLLDMTQEVDAVLAEAFANAEPLTAEVVAQAEQHGLESQS